MDCNEGKNAPITSIFVISGFNLEISTETCNLTPLRREQGIIVAVVVGVNKIQWTVRRKYVKGPFDSQKSI